MPLPTDDQNSSLQETNWHRLIRLMERDKPYLNPFLMQEDISAQLGLSTRTLSRLLSDRTNYNFCSFVNAYRLEAARAMLRDSRLRHLSMLCVAERSGFNSSGTFYRAFRETTAMSPAHYRKLYTKGVGGR